MTTSRTGSPAAAQKATTYPLPGPVIFFGSGETSPSGRKVFDLILQRLPPRPTISILETPAGFQPNSAAVAGQIAAFVQKHLRNFEPQTVVVPARRRDSAFSPDDPAIAAMLHPADAIFLGPGSPTYTVRQLHDTLTWQRLQTRHRLGAAILFASAAAIAAGVHVLPVYEIYKAGEELHWRQGLDFLAPFGLQLTFVPHWNNQEGGAGLDTSRCFMGRARFQALHSLLPDDSTLVGLDEHTALILDLAAGVGCIEGAGSVTLLRGGSSTTMTRGATFPLSQLGLFRLPAEPPPSLPTTLPMPAAAPAPAEPPFRVASILGQREAARQGRDWAAADALRAENTALGWDVRDTPAGPQLHRHTPERNQS